MMSELAGLIFILNNRIHNVAFLFIILSILLCDSCCSKQRSEDVWGKVKEICAFQIDINFSIDTVCEDLDFPSEFSSLRLVGYGC